MDEELNRTPFIIELLHRFAISFTPTLLVISFIAMLIARYAPDAQNVSTLFAPGTGLSFNTILQLTGFSVVTALLSILFFSERSTVKMRFSYRILCFFLLTLLTATVFSVIFGWFPVNAPAAWFGFILSFAICYSVFAILTHLILRLKGRKYNRLLANYKARNSGTGR